MWENFGAYTDASDKWSNFLHHVNGHNTVVTCNEKEFLCMFLRRAFQFELYM